MKHITLIIGLMVVGCGEVENGAYKHRPKQTDTNESTPTTTEKPVKELAAEQKQKALRDSVIGEYEYKNKEGVWRMVLLENGFVEDYENGKKLENKSKWKIAKGELHEIWNDGFISVLRINKDESITHIADIDKDGKRKDMPKEYQRTFKTIK